MAIRCGFFNSVDKDRLYPAEDMNKPYELLVSNGVFATQEGTPSNYLQVYGGNGMNVTVKAGRGIFADKWFLSDSDIIITINPNNAITPRIDSVIVRIDNRVTGRKGEILVLEGTPSSSLIAPAINTISNVKEYRLANIYVAPGATAINQDAITDMRGKPNLGGAPWVTSLIQQVDTSTLYIQWQKAFDDWFANVKETVATKTLIRSYTNSYTTTAQDETVIPIRISQYNHYLDILQVYVNGLMLIKDVEYTNNNDTVITLTLPVDKGTTVAFVVYKSIDGSDAESVVTQVNELQNQVNTITDDSGWINFTLEGGTQAYPDLAPGVRKYGNTIYLRGAITNVLNSGITIATLPTAYRPAMPHYFTQFVGGAGALSTAMFKINTNGTIVLVAATGTLAVNNMIPIATQFILG